MEVAYKTIYSKTEFVVEQEGRSSTWKEQETGIRQGCPLSAYVYAIYIEALDLALQSEPHIIGLPIPGREAPKSVLYADDLTLLLSGKTSITHVFIIFSRFES